MAAGWAVVVGVATVSLPSPSRPSRGAVPTSRTCGACFRRRCRRTSSRADHVARVGALPTWTVLVDGLLCALIVGWATTRSTRERTLRAAGVAAILTALFGMWQARTGIGLQTAWRVFDAGIIRINATYTDPNALAAFYALVGPGARGTGDAVGGVAARCLERRYGLVLVAMVMTAGRAGLAALAAGLLAMAMVALRRGLDEIDPSPFVRQHFRRAVRATVILLSAPLLLASCCSAPLLNVRHEQQTTYLHTWLYTFNLRQPPEAIAKGRIAVWQVAMAMIREHPLVGQGLGEAPARVRADSQRRLGIETLPRDAHLSPHNTYLLVTSELGCPRPRGVPPDDGRRRDWRAGSGQPPGARARRPGQWPGSSADSWATP